MSKVSPITTVVVSIVVILFIALLGALLWPYVGNTWLAHVGKPPAFTWWMGAMFALVPYVGKLSIPAAVITWIAMFFLN